MLCLVQLHSEAIKIRSVRSQWVLLAVIGISTPALALFVCLTGSLSADDTVLGGSLTGAVLALALTGAWGALVATSEYSSGTIVPVLASAPHRTRILVAKALIVAVLSSVIAVVSGTVAFATGALLLDRSQYALGSPFPALLGIGAAFAGVGVLGVAVGLLLRSSAGATAAVVGVVILPDLLGPLFGDLQPWVSGASASAVVTKLAQTADAAPEVMGSLGGWHSLLVLTTYTIAAGLLARWVFVVRDI